MKRRLVQFSPIVVLYVGLLLGAFITGPNAQTQLITGRQIANGAIQSQHLAAGLGTNPAGSVQAFAGSSAPSGWVLCDGATYDGTQQAYTALWGVIGTTYGGTGQSAFKVPDARGRAVIGAGQGTGLTNRVLATIGGAETHTLTTAEMPAHAHGVTDSGHSHSTGIYGQGGGPVVGTWVTANGQGSPAQTSTDGTGISIQNAGSGSAHANMQPWMALNAIIKL